MALVLFLNREARSTPAEADVYPIPPPVNVIGPEVPNAVLLPSVRKPPFIVVVPEYNVLAAVSVSMPTPDFVRFRLLSTPKEVQLLVHGKHTLESHSKDRGLKLP